ncbi:MAG TPA: SDR family oxidoreductase [Solirubrobacteraceae bacterium]|jgi:NAD(P)-dependent dehydrogenase (short-subunit alcohol dehydrogenase family)
MAKTPRSLTGKVVAITGGGRGIGRATAAALIARGARVALGDIDAALAARTAEELGGPTIGLPLDVTDPASFERFLAETEDRLGPLDVLVNNAGIMPIGPFTEEPDQTTAQILDINIGGVVTGSKLALRRFLPRGSGHIVNIASSAGKTGLAGGVTYCASKHAVVGLSEAIRQEVKGTSIGLSIVMPIPVNTELGAGLHRLRGFPAVEPEAVAREIVAALQFERVDVYVPRRIGWLLRAQGVLPRRVVDLISKLLGADKVLASPDRAARAAYEARISLASDDDKPQTGVAGAA